MKKNIGLLASSLLLILIGCGEDTFVSKQDPTLKIENKNLGQKQTNKTATPLIQPALAATVNDTIITVDEIDKSIELRLFDLEWRKYELRKAALNSVLKSRMAQQKKDSKKATTQIVEVLLTPPSPPRLNLPNDNRQVKGNVEAPIRLSLFCSYQSSHCARLQPIISQLENRFKGIINLAFYDLPQGYHRYGKAAAEAVRCAGDFAAPWDFQSALYSDINRLNKERFTDIAQQLGFDATRFSKCLDERRFRKQVNHDINLAQQLGLGKVPVMLISGLYVKGPLTFENYAYYIQQEMVRLALNEPVLSTLPLKLLATTVSNVTTQSSAIIELLASQTSTRYQLGDTVLDGVKLAKIEDQRILVHHQGKLEYIPLLHGSSQPAASANKPKVEHIQVSSLDHQQDVPEGHAPPKHREIKATGKMRLSRNWLTPHLKNQQALQSHFQAGTHEVDGVHLVKLKGIERNGFYRMLGLQEGDVVLRVNDEWVHDQHNPLWEMLETQEHITLTVMREGLPRRYDYKIK